MVTVEIKPEKAWTEFMAGYHKLGELVYNHRPSDYFLPADSYKGHYFRIIASAQNPNLNDPDLIGTEDLSTESATQPSLKDFGLAGDPQEQDEVERLPAESAEESNLAPPIFAAVLIPQVGTQEDRSLSLSQEAPAQPELSNQPAAAIPSTSIPDEVMFDLLLKGIKSRNSDLVGAAPQETHTEQLIRKQLLYKPLPPSDLEPPAPALDERIIVFLQELKTAHPDFPDLPGLTEVSTIPQVPQPTLKSTEELEIVRDTETIRKSGPRNQQEFLIYQGALKFEEHLKIQKEKAEKQEPVREAKIIYEKGPKNEKEFGVYLKTLKIIQQLKEEREQLKQEQQQTPIITPVATAEIKPAAPPTNGSKYDKKMADYKNLLLEGVKIHGIPVNRERLDKARTEYANALRVLLEETFLQSAGTEKWERDRIDQEVERLRISYHNQVYNAAVDEALRLGHTPENAQDIQQLEEFRGQLVKGAVAYLREERVRLVEEIVAKIQQKPKRTQKSLPRQIAFQLRNPGLGLTTGAAAALGADFIASSGIGIGAYPVWGVGGAGLTFAAFKAIQLVGKKSSEWFGVRSPFAAPSDSLAAMLIAGLEEGNKNITGSKRWQEQQQYLDESMERDINERIRITPNISPRYVFERVRTELGRRDFLAVKEPAAIPSAIKERRYRWITAAAAAFLEIAFGGISPKNVTNDVLASIPVKPDDTLGTIPSFHISYPAGVADAAKQVDERLSQIHNQLFGLQVERLSKAAPTATATPITVSEAAEKTAPTVVAQTPTPPQAKPIPVVEKYDVYRFQKADPTNLSGSSTTGFVKRAIVEALGVDSTLEATVAEAAKKLGVNLDMTDKIAVAEWVMLNSGNIPGVGFNPQNEDDLRTLAELEKHPQFQQATEVTKKAISEANPGVVKGDLIKHNGNKDIRIPKNFASRIRSMLPFGLGRK